MQENDEKLKNIFTRYLETAVMRTRNTYIKRQKGGMEELIGPEILQEILVNRPTKNCVIMNNLPNSWNSRKIRSWMKGNLDEPLCRAIECLTDFEIILVYAKVIEQMTFIEIATFLKMDWQKIASAYTYARKKVKKELKDNEI